MTEPTAIPNLRDRICELIARNLGDGGAFGLEVVGWDVNYGVWSVTTPQGPQQIPGYAVTIAARGRGPGGAVILGRQDFVMNMDVLPGPIPTEENVKMSIKGCYEALRMKVSQQLAGGDGRGQ